MPVQALSQSLLAVRTRTKIQQAISLLKSPRCVVWREARAMSQMFQDSAGTIPVTGVEQPVGLILDKRTAGQLGAELVTNGDFSNGLTGWVRTYSSWDVSSGVLTNDGSNIEGANVQQYSVVLAGRTYRIEFDLAHTSGTANVWLNGTQLVQSAIATSGHKTFTVTAAVSGSIMIEATIGSAFSVDNISVREIPGTHWIQATPASRPKFNSRYNRLVGTETLATQSVTVVAGTYQLRFSGVGTVTLSGAATGTLSAGTNSITCTAGTLTLTVSGTVTQADLLPATYAHLPYQRVTTATDYDWDFSKFPAKITYDGMDDGHASTAAVDLTGTDKITVVAAIHKASDAAVGVYFEHGPDSTATAGSFGIYAPGSVGPRLSFVVRGSATYTSATIDAPSQAAPVTRVITGYADIANDVCVLRLNGAQVASSTVDQGTGNYSSQTQYIGSRAGTSFRFKGDEFLTAEFIGNLTLSELSALEAYAKYLSKAPY